MVVAMRSELAKLLEAARKRPHMTAAEREDQTRNFAAGNVGMEDERVTRAVVDEAASRQRHGNQEGEGSPRRAR